MSDAFLTNFMRAAQQITAAERSIAVNDALGIIDSHNVDEALLSDDRFIHKVQHATREALADGVAVITNNLITDPEDAPQTNVHLTDLRMIVAIPVVGRGAIYFDQHIRQGVFDREMVDKLMTLSKQVIATGQTDISVDDLVAMYKGN